MAIKMVNVENTDETMSALLNALADAQREKQRYSEMYKLAINDIVELKNRLAKYETEVTL